jgi:large subunit ribosomal protein L18
MDNLRQRNKANRKRKVRYKLKKIKTDRLRLSVFQSIKHIYAQLIDDKSGKVLTSASTVEKECREEIAGRANKAAAEFIGKRIAEKALQLNIKKVYFDRGSQLYHGKTKVLADAARQTGLDF